ncbi:MAG: hypothetical protein FJ278_09525, partial [Planctomycetes bacterium]|nr:hypothetical protein [Planctomycetota bacterium]
MPSDPPPAPLAFGGADVGVEEAWPSAEQADAPAASDSVASGALDTRPSRVEPVSAPPAPEAGEGEWIAEAEAASSAVEQSKTLAE